MDRDTRAVAEMLGAATDASGLSAARFAAALGTSASRFSTYRSGRTKPTAQFCIRAQRLGTALARARDRRLMTGIDTVNAILSVTDQDSLLADAASGSRSSPAHDRRAGRIRRCLEDYPGTTGSIEFDTLLAALARLEFGRASIELPTWCATPIPLEVAWIPEHPFLDSSRVIATTPGYLAAVNVFVPARELITA